MSLSKHQNVNMELYDKIKLFILNENKLRSLGYPRPTGTPRQAKIYTPCTSPPPVNNVYICWRCQKEYAVNCDGLAEKKETCFFHDRGMGKYGYICCNRPVGSKGCTQCESHVHRYEDHSNLLGYVQTQPSDDNSKNYGVFAVDCEMSYTTLGLELTKVTVIDAQHKIIYNSYVKPLNPIVDYNEKFSGVNKGKLDKCTTTLADVQALFLDLFSDKTILVGHSLDSDMKALKILHNNMVDTSDLYPHQNPQYKSALKTLAKNFLNRHIQNNKSHDSAEDAIACMDLVLYKVKHVYRT